MKTLYPKLIKLSFVLSLFFLSISLQAQTENITGKVLEEEGVPLPYATVSLFQAGTKTLSKAEFSKEDGGFEVAGVASGEYFIEITYLGMKAWQSPPFSVNGKPVILEPVIMEQEENMMEAVIITGERPIVEVKPDRTVFNVQGTINAAGDNGLQLLRKAPGLVLDNNDNIIMMGRSGVLIYVDGKQLRLSGDDLSNYLQNLSSEQIDRIDIITNPGSKYDAQGNAGIIDIRLKKDKNLGYNGSVSTSLSQGIYAQGNINANGNYRNKKVNIFGGAGGGIGNPWSRMEFVNYQNGLILNEMHNQPGHYENVNFRVGTDWFVNSKSTLGLIVSGNSNNFNMNGNATNSISNQATPNIVDSILIANNEMLSNRTQFTYNLNYAQTLSKGSLNIDLDYGSFGRTSEMDQPNRYFSGDGSILLTEILSFISTPSNIDIASAKVDFEYTILEGQFSAGAKYTNVITDNTFLFYDVVAAERIRNNRRSNLFNYTEAVSAAYVNYARAINDKLRFSAGLRLEHTDAVGDLNAFLPELNEEPVIFNYFNWFPSAGLTYQASKDHTYGLNYSRRINRPDYKVLNPFREQASELAFSKGNPFLQPEIADNAEINYTYKYTYNLKVAYSHTGNKIARLISPDEDDPRAGFITWENLATQEVYSANLSFPVSPAKWFSTYFNLNASYIKNRAEYENGSTININAFTYNIFLQNTFTIPGDWKLELSGFYNGPGVWEGVMLTDPIYAVNVGIQKRFLDKLNVRLNCSDIFFTNQWSGTMNFNGLVGDMNGGWDSRRINLSISYDFGNQNVKARKRQTGLEAESKRVTD
ncbi:MAG: TonB-dependent receptor [Saprospiraceae bacterium]|nr:TonB-dependent receptor [Saprospiraceae bacterium]